MEFNAPRFIDDESGDTISYDKTLMYNPSVQLNYTHVSQVFMESAMTILKHQDYEVLQRKATSWNG